MVQDSGAATKLRPYVYQGEIAKSINLDELVCWLKG